MTKIISGIYKIINKINLHYYVGSSKEINTGDGRFYQHKNSLTKNKHTNSHLQAAWNKYGKENFDFIIVQEDIAETNLLTVEQTYLDIAKNEKEKCYNMTFIAGKVEMTEERRKKISDTLKRTASRGINHHRYGKKKIKPPKIPKSKLKDNKIHNLIHKTGETFAGTQNEFDKKYGFPISPLIKGRAKSRKGWFLISNQKPVNNRMNNNIYSVFNNELNLTFVGTCFEFHKKYPEVNRGNFFLMVKKKIESVSDWRLSDNSYIKPITNYSKNKLYEIINPNGEKFFTKNLADFCRKNSFNESGFRHVLKGRMNTNHGWTIKYVEEVILEKVTS